MCVLGRCYMLSGLNLKLISFGKTYCNTDTLTVNFSTLSSLCLFMFLVLYTVYLCLYDYLIVMPFSDIGHYYLLSLTSSKEHWAPLSVWKCALEVLLLLLLLVVIAVQRCCVHCLGYFDICCNTINFGLHVQGKEWPDTPTGRRNKPVSYREKNIFFSGC